MQASPQQPNDGGRKGVSGRGDNTSSPPTELYHSKKATKRLQQVLRSRHKGSQNIYGRKNELKMLQQTFDRVANQESPTSQLVLLTGPSGVGKSALVQSLMDWVRTERQSLTVSFGTGKYDQIVNNEPFAAIVSASNDLCDQIYLRGTNCVDEFNAAFSSLTGSVEEARMLNSAIPGLRQLTGDDQSDHEIFGSLSQTFTRFKQLWRFFLKAAKSVADVTVLFLDDIHWADANSLDLINSLVSTTGASKAKRLLLVCAYRNDATLEPSQEKTLRWCLGLDKVQDQTDSMESSRGFTYINGGLMRRTVIELGNLHEAETNEVVCGLLYGSAITLNMTDELSTVIHSHTQGNPLFVQYYLDYLTTRDLIRSTDGLSWDWSIDSIKNLDDVPESVSDLVLKMLSGVPEKTVELLMIAAHVGHQFSSVLLEQETLTGTSSQVGGEQAVGLTPSSDKKMRRQGSNALLRERARSTLDAAVDDGLLEKHGRRLYRFPHDQIQQSLYSMLSERPQEQALLHSKIGRTLLSLIEQSRVEKMNGSSRSLCHEDGFGESDLFTAVDNLNLGSSFVLDGKERLKLVSLNYDAAQLAVRKSAFVGAIKYARCGISLLGDDRWESNYDLCLDLYSLAARLEHCTGSFVRANLLISEIHRHGKTVLDRLPAFFTQIDVLGSRGEVAEAQTLGVMVLRQLGESMSHRPSILHVLYELFRSSRYMNRAKEKGFLNLPPLKDPAKIAAMTVLSSMLLYSFMLGTKHENSFAVTCLRIARISCRDGLSTHSPFGIVGYSAIQTTLGFYREAFETAKIGLDLLEHIDGADLFAARNIVGTFSTIAPMAGQSLEEIHHQFLRGYHVGVASGDVDYAYFSVVNHVSCSYFLGKTSLGDLHDEVEKYLIEMEEYQVNYAKWLITGTWQAIRRFVGKDLEDENVEGLNASGLISEMKAQRTPEMVPMVDKAHDILAKLVMATLGGSSLAEDERAVGFVVANGDAVHEHFTRVYGCCSYGVGSYELLRQTGKRKHRRNGRKALKEVRKLYKRGVTVAVAPFLWLTAEAVEASRRNRDVSSMRLIERAYLDAAVAAAGASRCILIEAYCYERLSKIVVGDDGGRQSQEYLDKAIEVYALWGASAKVAQLRRLVSLSTAVS